MSCAGRWRRRAESGRLEAVESEAELIARCRAGDAEAWDELFERYYPPAGRFVFQLSPALQPEDVEEICQDAFVAVVRNLAGFRGGSAFQTWLFRIAANKTRDFLSRQQTAKRGGGAAPVSLDAEHPGSGVKTDLPAPAPGPDAVLMNQERMTLVRECLDQLGDPCREIIELKYFGDLSYEEIAAELRMNPKTVSSRLSKCLDKLEELVRPRLSREEMTPAAV